MGVKGVDAESTGRDNDPGGLGDLPDSQSPNMAQSQERDSVSGLPHVTIRRLSHGTPLGREINNGTQGALILSLPHVFPPTYVGRVGIALGIPYSW